MTATALLPATDVIKMIWDYILKDEDRVHNEQWCFYLTRHLPEFPISPPCSYERRSKRWRGGGIHTARYAHTRIRCKNGTTLISQSRAWTAFMSIGRRGREEEEEEEEVLLTSNE